MAFAFDASFQRSLIRLMMLDPGFSAKALRWITPDHFTSDSLGWIFKTASVYHEATAATVTETVLREEVKSLPPEKQLRYDGEITLVVMQGSVPERDYITAKLKDFIRRNLFANAHRQSQALFNAGREDRAYDVMMRAIDEMQRVEFERAERAFFFEEFDDREKRRTAFKLHRRAYATGLTGLNERTDGGVMPGELFTVFAYPKRGKTTWLINQGFLATTFNHAPTLHIQLEGSKSQVEDRYDACFMAADYRAVKGGEAADLGYAKIRELRQEYADLRQLLVIRVINDWDANVGHIQTELAELKSQYGFVPEVLIVDYMDLLRSRHRVDSETQHQVDSARDLKRLVNQNEFAAWSAWQAQRPAVKDAHERKHILTSREVGDAFAKVRIVDCFMSLNMTNDEMREGRMRIYVESHRDADVNSVWVVENKFGEMRLVVDERPYDPSVDDDSE